MKKILYILPLLLLVFLPRNVFAAEFYNTYYYKASPLTSEQKQEYLNIILNYEDFIQDSKQYPYYLVFYQQSSGYIGSVGHQDYIAFMFFEEMPTFSVSNKDISLYYNKASKHYLYYYPTDFKNTSGLNSINFLKLNEQVQDENGNYNTKYYFLIDYVLTTNIELSLGYELKLYDSNDNLIKTYSADENIFEVSKSDVEIIYTIEDIEKADDTLYKLSKDLLGNLPEEFTFLYSICQLFLGLVIILVVLSPIILLLRLFR